MEQAEKTTAKEAKKGASESFRKIQQIREILTNALQNESDYQVQYVDYKENEWTAPYKLTADRYQKVMKDNSVKRIRILQVIEFN